MGDSNTTNFWKKFPHQTTTKKLFRANENWFCCSIHNSYKLKKRRVFLFCTGPSLVFKRKQNKQERDRGIENDRERDFFEMCIRGVAAAGGKHVLSPPHASDYWSLGQPPEAAVPGPPTTLPVHIVFALQRRAKRSSISEGRSESIIAQHFPKGINEMPVCFFFLLFRSELCPRLAATTTMNVSFLMTIYFLLFLTF